MGVIPPRVRSLIEKIQQSGGAAKAARVGGATGGVGMVFVVHPNVKALEAVLGSAPISVTNDPLLRQFIAVEPSVQQHPRRSMEPVELDV